MSNYSTKGTPLYAQIDFLERKNAELEDKIVQLRQALSDCRHLYAIAPEDIPRVVDMALNPTSTGESDD